MVRGDLLRARVWCLIWTAWAFASIKVAGYVVIFFPHAFFAVRGHGELPGRPSGMQSERLACLHELGILRPTLGHGAEADTQQPRPASSGASKLGKWCSKTARGTATL